MKPDKLRWLIEKHGLPRHGVGYNPTDANLKWVNPRKQTTLFHTFHGPLVIQMKSIIGQKFLKQKNTHYLLYAVNSNFYIECLQLARISKKEIRKIFADLDVVMEGL